MASMSRHVGRLGRSLGASAAAARGPVSVRPWTCGTPAEQRRGLRTTIPRRRSQVSMNSDPLSEAGPPKLDFHRLPEFQINDGFARRHIGPDEQSTDEMLRELDPPAASLDEFVQQVIPADILSTRPLFPHPRTEFTSAIFGPVADGHREWEVAKLGQLMSSKFSASHHKNLIGTGYYETRVPEVIKRNVLESPAWYTSYTPYQPEISQGRLESLLNFQTMVSDLTALPVANASLLDEGTAAAEAMTMSWSILPSSRAKRPGRTFVVSTKLHPQTKSVLRSRAEGFGIQIRAMDLSRSDFSEIEALGDDLVGVMVQYPDTIGQVYDFTGLADQVHKQGALLSAATDLMALTYLKPPGEWGADIAFGSAQRLGVPLGNGGPHAAFFAVKEQHKRKMPGRLVGVSKDRLGGRALRLALQTREQHIRRDKATSNVCTAQALLANMSAFYAVYHGPKGLREIAERINLAARVINSAAWIYGWKTNFGSADAFVPFDTVRIMTPGLASVFRLYAKKRNINIRRLSDDMVSMSFDETIHETELLQLIDIFAVIAEKQGISPQTSLSPKELLQHLMRKHKEEGMSDIPHHFLRTSEYLTHPVFNTHHSETELLRYIHHLQSKDLSLVHSMIPLGSCTMKLNGSTEMSLITLPGFANIHPHAIARPYKVLIGTLEAQLKSITAMDGVSLQPNSGAQGEFAGLAAIRRYHQANGQDGRNICLIPVSAHGTNPASAAMAGMQVVPIQCDAKTGNLDLADLEAKCQKHSSQIAAMMITYPSTFGIFEPAIKKVCEIVHEHGGQVYMDGANMNAQIGLCSPGEIGADVCHLNLHKTFCIPHGGGGPGVGPICVKEHLIPYLPTTDVFSSDAPNHPVSSAPYGSAGILPISWAYNALMGADGLKHATKITLLSANYLLSKLKPHYKILYSNDNGRCAHEFILDVRPLKKTADIEAVDIAKRLQDYGFHAPTMSWPVANTLMIEPTESESKEELDRFVDALVAIREEIREVEDGVAPREGNVLKMAPHPMADIIDGDGGAWDRPYSRQKAAYPLPWLREKKFWPSVARVDDLYGDSNLFCTCPPVEDTTGGGNLSSTQED